MEKQRSKAIESICVLLRKKLGGIFYGFFLQILVFSRRIVDALQRQQVTAVGGLWIDQVGLMLCRRSFVLGGPLFHVCDHAFDLGGSGKNQRNTLTLFKKAFFDRPLFMIITSLIEILLLSSLLVYHPRCHLMKAQSQQSVKPGNLCHGGKVFGHEVDAAGPLTLLPILFKGLC